MLAEARRNRIVQLVREGGEMPTEDLARALDVSVETIRRDLRELETRSVLHRVHGGAVAPHLSGEAPYADRRSIAADEKRAMARLVVEQIPSDATVFLDLGTTIDEVVAALSDDFRGTIITTSLRAAMDLARLERADILVAGGKLRRGELSLSGSVAQKFLNDTMPDIALVSTGAVSATRGVTDFDVEELQVKRIVLGNARTTFVLADSSKFGQTATYRVCSVADPSFIVSTTKVSEEHRSEIEQAGGQLLLAPMN